MNKPFNPPLPLLLVDDETSWLRSLTITLKSAGYNHLLQCPNSRETLELMARQPISLVLLDLVMPHLCGEELLTMITEEYPQVPVIILSGLNQLETAVKCMSLGAFDYFVKTTEAERLIGGIQRALTVRELREENHRLKEHVLDSQLKHPEVFVEITAASDKMLAIFRYLEAVAKSSEPLLITGESGVGKELISKAAHRLSRPNRPLVTVNIAGLDDNVFSDTLFGHRRGAFTGAERERAGLIEMAGNGTLLLDEIGDLSPGSQIKLLRLLQEGEFFPLGSDTPKRTLARIICATNQSLEEKIAVGQFRKDLYYRLCAHHLHVPPLRERQEDLPLLLRHYVAEAAKSLGKAEPVIPETLVALLATYYFPGNIREVRAMIYDAISLHQSGNLSLETFRKAIKRAGYTEVTHPVNPTRKQTFSCISDFPDNHFPTLREAGDLHVTEAIRRTGGNLTAAARLLGVTRQAVSKRLNKLSSPSRSTDE